MMRKISAFLLSYCLLTLGAKAQSTPDPSSPYPRKMVVEEWTGTWCGMCVRGIVGMHYMEENYGNEDFIGIAVHNNDRMESPSYKGFIDNYILSSYPGCIINRTKVADPSAEVLQNNYDIISQSHTYCRVEASAIPPEKDASSLEVSATASFAIDLEEANLMMTFVITQNDVGPYPQYNNYSSGMFGPMEGWENKGNYVLTTYDDVVRDATDCLGIPGSIPGQIEAGKDYTFSTTLSLDNVTDIDKCRLVVLLIDGNNGEIVNADRIDLHTSGIETPRYTCEPTVSLHAGMIKIEGDFARAELYATDGKKSGEITTEAPFLNVPSGLYILTLTSKSGHFSSQKLIVP